MTNQIDLMATEALVDAYKEANQAEAHIWVLQQSLVKAQTERNEAMDNITTARVNFLKAHGLIAIERPDNA